MVFWIAVVNKLSLAHTRGMERIARCMSNNSRFGALFWFALTVSNGWSAEMILRSVDEVEWLARRMRRAPSPMEIVQSLMLAMLFMYSILNEVLA